MEYSLGAIKNKQDLRDIQLVQVQAPISIPDKYQTDISWIPVLDQKLLGTCVGHAHALIHIYNEFKENKKIIKASPRYLYALSKKYDGNTNEGTYPRTTAKIQKANGCATEDKVKCDDTLSHSDYINIAEEIYDAPSYKVKGYAFVPNDLQALKQAIYQNGLVALTISVGNFDNPIKKGSLGLHRVVAYGYNGDKIAFRNSWGMGWGEQGNGYFTWGDQDVYDIMTFVDMPNELLEEVKKKYRNFSDKEVAKFKLKDELWKLLDDMRDYCGFPFVISSGLRTKEENDKLSKSVEDSAHLTGEAADISCPDSIKRFKMIEACNKFGVKRYGIGKNFIHIDIDKTKPQNVTWHYYE